MAVGKYLERRDVQLFIVAGFLVALLLISQYGPFLAYGVPGVTVHEVTQTKPVSKSVTILSSYGDWVSYEYYGVAVAEDKVWDWCGRRAEVALSVTLKIKIETSSLALSGFLTEVKPPPFLVNETVNQYIYKNITVHAYSYAFKLTVSWSGSAQVSILSTKEWGPVFLCKKTMDELIKDCVSKSLIPDFNKNYLTSAKILLSIDAPTLARDKAYELRPDYLGIAGMWLADYEMAGYGPGTAAELLPQSVGSVVKLYRDKALTSPCWAPDYQDGKPLLTPDVVYWLDHFAPPCAWWSISIVNLGSQLVYDPTRPKPNYLCWAWEKYGGSQTAPTVAQWFRVDLLFRVTKDWVVPKIPEYELPPEVKEKMRIIVLQKPENRGVPLDVPPKPEFPWTQITMVLLVVFGGSIAVIVVYYAAKRKWE